MRMERIRCRILVGMVLVATLIRGEVIVELRDKYIRNAIVVRINATESCPLVSDFFPSRVIITEERQNKIEDYRDTEPIIVTVYNVQTDTICDSRRKYLFTNAQRKNSTRSTFQLFSICSTCLEERNLKLNQLIQPSRGRNPTLLSTTATRRLKPFENHNNETKYPAYKAKLFCIQNIGRDESSIAILMKGSDILVSGDRKSLPHSNLNDGISTTRRLSEAIHGIGVSKYKPKTNNETENEKGPEGQKKENHYNTQTLFINSEPIKHSMIGVCSTEDDECCHNHDCPDSNNVCVNRHCIDEGFPRFTLEWHGSNDLDLVVKTPSGVELSFLKDYDPTTGGKVGESLDQYDLGFHVENTYFPLTGAPAGTYHFYVLPFVILNVNEAWTITVHDENGEVFRKSGVGASEMFSYERLSRPFHVQGNRQSSPTNTSAPVVSPPSPTSTPTKAPSPVQPPIGQPRSCNTKYDECCQNSDCLFSGEICEFRNCINEGNPRITLYWEGSDDIDLFVETPGGVELSFVNIFDAVSGGRFGEEADQFGSGFHVENVFFPTDGGTVGTYKFLVRPASVSGGADKWTVDVVDNDEVVMTQSGYGASSEFTYRKTSTATTPTNRPAPSPRPTPPPGGPTDGSCSIFFNECCVDSDCRTSRDVCEQNTCIRDGNPRLTLTWNGDDDLDFFIITPLGTEISRTKPFDQFSGGRHEQDQDQSGSGPHVENIYFPALGAPTGGFSYGVRSNVPRGSADAWTIRVYEDGLIVDTRIGSGASSFFLYDRPDGSDGPQRPISTPPRCSPLTDECCLDSDCEGAVEICVQRVCLNLGFPRISLTWTGDDDLDLRVVSPLGTVISRQNEYDPDSGGQFESSPYQTEFGFHVESVYFPGGLDGLFKFNVKSITARGIGNDIWNVAVYEGDQMVQDHSGTGDSAEFFFDRGGGLPNILPTAPPNQFRPTSVPNMFPTPLEPLECPQECCADYDCEELELCVQRTCITNGILRFTLTWTGFDNIDLLVITPDESILSNAGGFFEEDSVQDGFGFHVENIVFPYSTTAAGLYTYYVRAKAIIGAKDNWELRVYANLELVALQFGRGDSVRFTYDFNGGGAPAIPSRGPTTAIPTDYSPGSPEPSIETGNTSSNPSVDLDFCEPKANECCEDSDCVTSQACVQRVCIEEGNPRFTLEWVGDDDLDLVIVTPLGGTISILNRTDEASGGNFGKGGDQFEFGLHVENIYFNTTRGGSGVYGYYIIRFVEKGAPDDWTLSIYANGQIEEVVEGTGEYSSEYTFSSVQGASQTQFDLTDSSFSLTRQECYSENDCKIGVETCVNRICINLGNPRFTLTYTGDDDLDLEVETPHGSFVSFRRPVDERSGGFFEEDENTFGRHVENIYFVEPVPSSGIYKYKVTDFITRGAIDHWTVAVYVNNEQIDTQRGQGDSITFELDIGFKAAKESDIRKTELAAFEPIQSSLEIQIPCDTSTGDDCCSSIDCGNNEVCFQRTCIDEGNPRFTLAWHGTDEYELFVIPPIGDPISSINQHDEDSGGIYGEDPLHSSTGLHVQNVFFPLIGGIIGNYTFYVKLPYTDSKANDHWTVRAYVEGEQVYQQHGVGEAGPLSYEYSRGSSLAPRATNTCSLSNDECCSDSDCKVIGSLCVARSCIADGNPRFSLTWLGDDDLDLVVVTPAGNEVSYYLPTDKSSNGLFDEEGVQFRFGYHVENVLFPAKGGPTGTYKFYTTSFQKVGEDDEWNLQVFVDGVEKFVFSGKGDSEVFKFDFDGISGDKLPRYDENMGASDRTGVVVHDCKGECCAHSECPGKNSMCIHRRCRNFY